VTSLRGVVASGLGEAARFMALPWVQEAIRGLAGFDPYPGTLNVRLVDPDMVLAWRRVREGPALRLTPPPDWCGARLFRVTVTPDVVAAVIVPDVTRHGDDLLEVVAGVHVRSRLGLSDGDLVTLRY
jgi:riboflavin kinase